MNLITATSEYVKVDHQMFSKQVIRFSVRNSKNIININDIKYKDKEYIKCPNKRKTKLCDTVFGRIPKCDVYIKSDNNFEFVVLNPDTLQKSENVIMGWRVDTKKFHSILSLNIYAVEGMEDFDDNDDTIVVNIHTSVKRIDDAFDDISITRSNVSDDVQKDNNQAIVYSYYIDCDKFPFINTTEFVKFNDIIPILMEDGIELDDNLYKTMDSILSSRKVTKEDKIIQLSMLRQCNLFKHTNNILKILYDYLDCFYDADSEITNGILKILFDCTYRDIRSERMIDKFLENHLDMLSIQEKLDLFSFLVNKELQSISIKRIINSFGADDYELLMNYFYQNNKTFVRE